MSALQNAEALRDYRISRTLGFMRGGPPPGWREDDDEAARQVPLDSMKRRTPDRDARSCEPKTHSELSGPIAFRGTKNRKKIPTRKPGCQADSQTEWRPGFNPSKDARRDRTGARPQLDDGRHTDARRRTPPRPGRRPKWPIIERTSLTRMAISIGR